jgi:alkyl sulfatase BDS1-like metallo-beta-lactamase superfamily hydrolase
MNLGYVGAEIAEMLEMPPALAEQWHTHGYYGSVSHNVKAVYQRYLGWYDGNPAHLWPHPPVAAAERYVAAMGGAEAAVALAQQAFDEGDLRWAVEVLNHVLFADEHHEVARALQADAFEQIAFGAENGTWRNVFLVGAKELRDGEPATAANRGAPDLLGALSVEQILSSVAIRIDGPKAWDIHLVLSFVITDLDECYVFELRNGVANHRRTSTPAPDSTTLSLGRRTLIGLFTGRVDFVAALGDGTIVLDGDPATLGTLVSVIGTVERNFPIVTP